jgi:hypothetical protein
MYQWYQRAVECFVYLQDVELNPSPPASDALLAELRSSSWFTRGWTLQELLAPEIVIFCNASWEVIGHHSRRTWLWLTSRNESYGPLLQEQISDITKISLKYLVGHGGQQLKDASIAQRMTWASNRDTTRIEDEAYCLLGIFDINMPLIYGEGRKAFLRLQEEIVRRSTDQSIFAWDELCTWEAYPAFQPILAKSIKCFRNCTIETDRPLLSDKPYTITNNGLEMRTTLSYSSLGSTGHRERVLELRDRRNSHRLRIPLYRIHSNCYCRSTTKLEELKDDDFEDRSGQEQEEQLIYIATGGEHGVLSDWKAETLC